MNKIHTKANGYFKDLCHYSRAGWAWWRYPQPGDVCIVPSCTCIPCKAPKWEDKILEGFPDISIDEFITMFCKSHKHCGPRTEINRIEFTEART